MKKPLHSISFFASLAVFCGAMCFGTLLHAQQNTPDPQSQQSPAQQTPDTQSPTQPQQSPAQTQQTPDTQAPPAAQQPPETPSERRGQSSPDQAAAPDQSSGQTFTGTVVQQGDKYVLQSDNGTVYDIDHQDQVKKFEGKRVRIHGTLDASGKMIHVQ